MSANKGTYVSLILLFILAISYGVSAINFRDQESGIGPHYFPIILSILLILLCIISVIQTVKKEDKKIEMPNKMLLFGVLCLIVAFILGWEFIGYYIVSIFFLFILFTLFRMNSLSKKVIFINIIWSISVTISIYFVFDFILGVGL
ncbi:tripartite tricarboxylate transporter TctB family protein [Salicibibacter cibarius]|uniref:Tripartite tricarboxylate transporter TctB family protein n=1 Tax=Salicibibacter cibarius TaxID=2743000 RepID=A0A7T7CDA5_9BACI|nr:tripartite tricarboxylate transporter TctB family protein [Salicibibacter cibarius]QQK77792.1 tripartite tricarboxylate transporter TctB family protein [Salicibibacter cibarius]